MEKGKVIDLGTYREGRPAEETISSSSMSEELKHAIQMLIHRLKEEGPLSQPA